MKITKYIISALLLFISSTFLNTAYAEWTQPPPPPPTGNATVDKFNKAYYDFQWWTPGNAIPKFSDLIPTSQSEVIDLTNNAMVPPESKLGFGYSGGGAGGGWDLPDAPTCPSGTALNPDTHQCEKITKTCPPTYTLSGDVCIAPEPVPPTNPTDKTCHSPSGDYGETPEAVVQADFARTKASGDKATYVLKSITKLTSTTFKADLSRLATSSYSQVDWSYTVTCDYIPPPPVCPTDSVLNPTTNQCERKISDCPQGSILNSDTKQCELPVVCPSPYVKSGDVCSPPSTDTIINFINNITNNNTTNNNGTGTATDSSTPSTDKPAQCKDGELQKKICDFIDWYQKDKPLPQDDGKIDIKKDEDSKINWQQWAEKNYLTLPANCPGNPFFNIPFLGAVSNIFFPIGILCKGCLIMKPFIMLWAFAKAIAIIGSTNI